MDVARLVTLQRALLLAALQPRPAAYLIGLVARIVEPIAPNFFALRRVSSELEFP